MNFASFYKRTAAFRVFQRLNTDNNECDLCYSEVDSPEHAILCPIILKHIHISDQIKYEHIFGTLEEQEAVTNTFIEVLKVRSSLLEGEIPADRGLVNTGPSVLHII